MASNRIDRLLRSFLWTAETGKTRYCTVGWDLVCSPKEVGGLGLRETSEMDKYFMFKWIWRLLKDDCSLWVKWTKANYFKNSYYWTAKPSASDSWKSLLNLKEEMAGLVTYKIGNGVNTSLWYAPWVQRGHICF